MKKQLSIAIVIAASLAIASAQDARPSGWRIYSGLQGGLFAYRSNEGANPYAEQGPLIVATAQAEYHFRDVGVGAGLEVRSYRWKSIDESYPAIARIMGAPGFAGGVAAWWHLLPAASRLDAFLSASIGCNVYLWSAEDAVPAFDFGAEAGLTIPVSGKASIGPRLHAKRSYIPRVTLRSDGTTKKACIIGAYDLGLIASFEL